MPTYKKTAYYLNVYNTQDLERKLRILRNFYGVYTGLKLRIFRSFKMGFTILLLIIN